MNVLIVEDELPIRKHLISLLSSSEITVFEAGDGEAALAILAGQQVDIIITDIQMPTMDGIELIRQCQMRFPHSKTIVLTNFAEFDLVQKALRYGAKSYLLKATITKESLGTELKQVFAENQRDISGKFDPNELLTIQNSLFYERLNDCINTPELIKLSERMKTPFFSNQFGNSMFVYMEVDHFADWASSKFKQETDLAVFAISNVIREITQQFDPGNEMFHLAKNRFIILDLNETELDSHRAKMEKIQKALKQYLSLDSSFIIGYPFSAIDQFFESINETLSDFDRLFYSSYGCILAPYVPKDVNNEIDLYSFFQGIQLDQENRLTLSNLPGWVKSFFELIRNLRRPQNVVKDDLKFLISFIEKRGIAVNNELKGEIARRQGSRLTDYMQIFERWLYEIASSGGDRPEIIKALQYIHDRFQDKVMLDDICAYVNLSRSHLSKVFKEHQGLSIIEYLESYRMKQARLLLRTTPLKLSEISERVGVLDLFYFSKLYKRYYSINPSKDRGHE